MVFSGWEDEEGDSYRVGCVGVGSVEDDGKLEVNEGGRSKHINVHCITVIEIG